MESKGRLVSDETVRMVLERYNNGDKVVKIAEDAGIPRATLYWILEKNGVAPKRAHNRKRFATDGETVEALYALIVEQEEYIASLEEEVTSLRARLKDVRAVTKKLN